MAVQFRWLTASSSAVRCVTAIAILAAASTTLAQSLPYGAALPQGAMSPTAGPGVVWEKDLDAAKASAKTSGKLVLVHFWTPTCGPCRVLDNQVFNQPAVGAAVRQGFVPVKINANDAQALAQSYGITQVPTDVVLTADGKVVEKMVSPNTPMAYVSRLMDSVAKVGSAGAKGFQKVAGQSPYNQSPYGASVNSAYANLSIPPSASTSQTPPAATPNAATIATQSAPTQPTPTQQTLNPYAQPATSANPPATSVAAQPPVTPQAEAPQQPKPPVAATAAAPQLPPGSPPLAFDGCCPVTMKKSRRWIKGDPKWGARHRGRTYLFVSQAERDAFLQDADTYSPVLSGIDPVLALEQGKTVEGKREFGLEYLDSIYLFSSEESLNRFWSNPTRYATGVRQAMAGSGTMVR